MTRVGCLYCDGEDGCAVCVGWTAPAYSLSASDLRARHARGGARVGAGRPALPPAERRDVRIVPRRVTLVERVELAAWAAREGQPLGGLLVDRALRAARRSR